MDRVTREPLGGIHSIVEPLLAELGSQRDEYDGDIEGSSADAAITLPGLLFGGEEAAVGEFGEFDAAACLRP